MGPKDGNGGATHGIFRQEKGAPQNAETGPFLYLQQSSRICLTEVMIEISPFPWMSASISCLYS
jgi:hypothetical protein